MGFVQHEHAVVRKNARERHHIIEICTRTPRMHHDTHRSLGRTIVVVDRAPGRQPEDALDQGARRSFPPQHQREWQARTLALEQRLQMGRHDLQRINIVRRHEA
ncbi:hypothetical protein D3C72_2040440 [compost metagenome]